MYGALWSCAPETDVISTTSRPYGELAANQTGTWKRFVTHRTVSIVALTGLVRVLFRMEDSRSPAYLSFP